MARKNKRKKQITQSRKKITYKYSLYLKSLIILSILFGTLFLIDKIEFFKELRCNDVDTANLVKKSVVKIKANDAYGTGFYINKGKYIVTNNHVVEGVKKVSIIQPNGISIEGEVINGDEKVDIAVIKPNLNYDSYLNWLDNQKVKTGINVSAVGFIGAYYDELKGEATITKGIVSSIRKNEINTKYIQTDAEIGPGNSGGPLVDKCGRIVGINTFILTEEGYEGIHFAISSENAQKSISYLIENPSKFAPRGTHPAFGEGIDPEELVKGYYYYLDVKDYPNAYLLLDSSVRKNTEFNEWQDLFSNVDYIDIENINKVQSNPPKIKVVALIQEYDGINTIITKSEILWAFDYNHGNRTMYMEDYKILDKHASFDTDWVNSLNNYKVKNFAYFDTILRKDLSKYDQNSVTRLKDLISRFKEIVDRILYKAENNIPLTDQDANEYSSLNSMYDEINVIITNFNKQDWENYFENYY